MAVVSSIAMWFSNNKGIVSIVWLGWKFETNTSFFLLSLFIAFFLLIFSSVLFFKVVSFPRKVREKVKSNQINIAYNNLYDGLIASSYGNQKALQKHLKISKKYLKESPLKLLLELREVSFKNNDVDSFNILKKMLKYKTTQPIAIKGIILIASKSKDVELFKNMLYKSKELKLNLKWFIEEVTNFAYNNNAWLLIANHLEDINNIEINKETLSFIYFKIADDYYRNNNMAQAEKYILKASKYNKYFPPIFSLGCKLQIYKDKRSFIKNLKKYWQENPNPNILDCVQDGINSKNPIMNLNFINEIFSKNEKSHIAYFILGQLKLKGKAWGEAKKDLEYSIDIKPTKEAYLKLIELEKQTNKDPALIAQLKEKLLDSEDNFKWTCKECNYIQPIYSVICGNCKKFNSLVWYNSTINASDIYFKSINNLSLMGLL